MKGFIACTLALCSIFMLKQSLKRDLFIFLLHYDEETACQGAPVMIERIKKKRN